MFKNVINLKYISLNIFFTIIKKKLYKNSNFYIKTIIYIYV